VYYIEGADAVTYVAKLSDSMVMTTPGQAGIRGKQVQMAATNYYRQVRQGIRALR